VSMVARGRFGFLFGHQSDLGKAFPLYQDTPLVALPRVKLGMQRSLASSVHVRYINQLFGGSPMEKAIQGEANGGQRKSSCSVELNEEYFKVPSHRLSSGEWSSESQKEIGTGDIRASYSADLIGPKSKVRRPFQLNGHRYVAVSFIHHRKVSIAKAYRLVPVGEFQGMPTSYADKNHKEVRRDPNGFYHGMTVSQGGKTYVLFGPPILIGPGGLEPSQPSLF